MSGSALILIDIQNDFLPGGSLAVPDGAAIFGRVRELAAPAELLVMTQDWHPRGHVSFASSHDRPIFSTIDTPHGPQMMWPDHCVANTSGAEIPLTDLRDAADLILRKGASRDLDSYSAFFENDRETATPLHAWLRDRGVRSLTLAGLAYDYCVGWSALDAARLGYDVTVDRAGCRGIAPDSSDAMTVALLAAGVSVRGADRA